MKRSNHPPPSIHRQQPIVLRWSSKNLFPRYLQQVVTTLPAVLDLTQSSLKDRSHLQLRLGLPIILHLSFSPFRRIPQSCLGKSEFSSSCSLSQLSPPPSPSEPWSSETTIYFPFSHHFTRQARLLLVEAQSSSHFWKRIPSTWAG